MAKGGLISLTQALAGAYSPKGIRVNAICPGVVLTDRVKSRFVEGNQIRFGGIDKMAAALPVRRRPAGRHRQRGAVPGLG